MKKFVILTSVLALAACGGGSGGGVSNMNNEISEYKMGVGNIGNVDGAKVSLLTNLFDGDTETSINPNTSLYSSDGTEIYLSVATTTSSQNAPGRIAITRESVTQSNGNILIKNLSDEDKLKLFDNMLYCFQHPEKVTSEATANVALIIFNGVTGKDKDDAIKITSDNFQNIFAEYTDVVKEISKHYGHEQKIDLANIEFSNGDGASLIKFTVDQGRIIGMNFIDSKGIESREVSYRFNLQQDGSFKVEDKKLYVYYLDDIDYVGDHDYDPMYGYKRGYEDGNKEVNNSVKIVSEKQLTLAELKTKFTKEIELLYNEGWFNRMHNTKTGETQEAASEAMYLAAKERVENLTAANYASECHETTDIESFSGRLEGEKLGLTYANFGRMIVVDENGNDTEGFVYYGGDKEKLIAKTDILQTAPDKDLEFKGKIKGTVLSKTSDVKSLNADAKLILSKNGSETLTANFSKQGWYNVTVKSSELGTNYDITFDGTNVNLDDKFKFDGHIVKGGDSYTVEDFAKTTNYLYDPNDDGITGSQEGSFNVQYYGSDKQPIEFVGGIHYSEGDPSVPGSGNDVIFDAGFGGIKSYK